MEEFVEREVESEEAAHVLPFVTVNKKTNLVAIHSRLLQGLSAALVKSVQRLNIPPDSGAFDEVRWNIQTRLKPQSFFFSWRGQRMWFAKRTGASTAESSTEFGERTGSATTWRTGRQRIGERPLLQWDGLSLLLMESLEREICTRRARLRTSYEM